MTQTASRTSASHATPSTLKQRVAQILSRVASATQRAGRDPENVTLIAVSKRHPAERLLEAYALGLRDFGENYVQEWQRKAAALPEDIRWHFIGRVQSNKLRHLAPGPLQTLHTLDRADHVLRLERRRATLSPAPAPLDVLIEVSVSGEAQKGGVAPENLRALAEAIAASPSLRLRGLMTMPPWGTDPEEARPFFIALRDQLHRLQDALPALAPDLNQLSMGMSSDFEVAIEEGSTLVRVGTAIFGPRTT